MNRAGLSAIVWLLATLGLAAPAIAEDDDAADDSGAAAATTDEAAPEAADFVVVMNDQKQYSIWPANRELPPGWMLFSGPCARTACMQQVRQANGAGG